MVAEDDAVRARQGAPPSESTPSSGSVKQELSDGDALSSERFFCEELEEDLVETIETSNADEQRVTQRDQMVQSVAQNLIGRHQLFDSPFGDRALCYADFTASGKSLKTIEDYIQHHVMPLYGNTHTTTSITGLQTTCFRHEARQILAQAVNAKITGRGAEDSVLFTGQGSTSAVAQLVTALGLHVPLPVGADAASQRPVVFVGPFEHHSNLLPWRESVAQVVVIPENDRGLVDIDALARALQQFADRPLKIGAFSAASNLTGVLTDVDRVTATLHMHGALAFWDYASCAPYVAIDMNPVVADEALRPFVYKDAVYFSGHKFIGGPGSPGVLVVKKRLLGNAVPTTPGGGTVFFVTETDHRYLSNREEREEGGTPDILGSIRLGLAFEIKQRIGTQHIMELERKHVARVRSAFAANDKIVLLGRQYGETKVDAQLPIFSFLIRWGDRFLHYNFVCALLNDLFGIQTRGGCQCAGPYATRLLGMAKDDVLALERALIEKKEMLRPGFSRMSVPYFMEDDEVDYILEAIQFVAEEGWKFLPQYKFNHKSGAWKHTSRFTKFPNRKWLSHFSMNLTGDAAAASTSKPTTATATPVVVEDIKQHRLDNFVRARELAADTSAKGNGSVAAAATQMLEESYEALRWFVYPAQAAEALKKGVAPVMTSTIAGPYQPQRYLDGSLKHQWEVAAENEPSTPSAVGVGSTPVAANTQSVCQTGTCCPAPVASSSSSSSSRQLGGKYPLRSTSTTTALPMCGLAAPPSCAVPPGLVADAADNLARAQQATTEMTEKTAAVKLFPTPGKKMMRWVGQALMQWNMIQEGDRILLGVSGGKDSLSLLHILLNVQKRAPVKFYLACATVDPQTPSFDPSSLKEYMKALGIEYHYLSENIIERATCEMKGDSLCAYCARMKRGLLYTCCRKNKFNKLVLAQHLDDLAESFFMSAIHNGQLRTMKAKYWNDEKDVEILRPLAYVREHELKKFAYDSRLPVINENCPACFEEPKERHRIKKMLATEETLNPEMYNSIRRALLPLMDGSVYEPLDAIRDRIEKSKQARPKAASSKQSKEKPMEPVVVVQEGEENKSAVGAAVVAAQEEGSTSFNLQVVDDDRIMNRRMVVIKQDAWDAMACDVRWFLSTPRCNLQELHWRRPPEKTRSYAPTFCGISSTVSFENATHQLAPTNQHGCDMSGKDTLLVNPEEWTPKQLEQWLRRFEKGRFKQLTPHLRKFTGFEVVHFVPAQWAQVQPRELATSLRFTLLGMMQVATNSDDGSDTLTIVTDFTPRGPPSPRRQLHGATAIDSGDGTVAAAPRKPVRFPPMLEIPTIPVLVLLAVGIVGTVLCFTVLKKPLEEDAHVSSHQLLKYGSIPIVSVVFTYIHIWLALYMTFYPLQYVGCLQIPGTNAGCGWQGIVPHKAEKMARQAVRIMTTQLLRVSDVFAKLEPARIVDELEPLLFGTIREIIEQMATKYNPELWGVLSEDIKEEIVEKVKEEAPQHIESLMTELRDNIEDVFDLEDMVVNNFCKDKQLLVNMFVTCGYQELAFIRNSGAWMGFLFGLLQMGLWFFYSNRIVVFPVVGFVVGTITNWLALKMIFEPVEPKRVCFGLFTLHGLFLRRQSQVAEVYGQLVATEVLTSRNIIDAILKGPYSDRLFELVYDNVQQAVHEATSATEQIASLGLGEATFNEMKQDVTDHIVNAFPQSLRQIEEYATQAMDLEKTLREKLKTLSSAQFEQLLHPIFQEDEWKLVLMGGVLGLVIGFLQAFFINH